MLEDYSFNVFLKANEEAKQTLKGVKGAGWYVLNVKFGNVKFLNGMTLPIIVVLKAVRVCNFYIVVPETLHRYLFSDEDIAFFRDILNNGNSKISFKFK